MYKIIHTGFFFIKKLNKKNKKNFYNVLLQSDIYAYKVFLHLKSVVKQTHLHLEGVEHSCDSEHQL